MRHIIHGCENSIIRLDERVGFDQVVLVEDENLLFILLLLNVNETHLLRCCMLLLRLV